MDENVRRLVLQVHVRHDRFGVVNEGLAVGNHQRVAGLPIALIHKQGAHCFGVLPFVFVQTCKEVEDVFVGCWLLSLLNSYSAAWLQCKRIFLANLSGSCLRIEFFYFN